MTAPRTLRPFWQGTRRHYQITKTFSVDSAFLAAQNTPAPLLLDKTGMLCALWLVVKGTFTVGTSTATLAAEGLASLFSRVQVTANTGGSAIVDLSGPGLETLSRFMQPMGPRGRISALTVGAGRTFEYLVRIPVAANDTLDFGLGAINLQDPQIQVTLAMVLNPFNTVIVPGGGGGTVTAATMTIEVTQEYWEIPDPTVFALPPRAIVRSLEDLTQGLAVGENIYQMPRLGTLLQYAQAIRIAGVPATFDDVDYIRLRLNKTVELERRSSRLNAAVQAYNAGALAGSAVLGSSNVTSDIPMSMAPGVHSFDYWHAQGIMNAGEIRDAIDTEEIVTTEYITSVSATAALANNNTDFIRHVRRVAQQLP